MANKNAVKFSVGADSTAQKLVEKAFLDGCDQARWFRPEPHVSTYMELAHAAARKYARELFGCKCGVPGDSLCPIHD